MTQISKKDSVRAAFSRSSRRIGTFCFGAGPQQGGSTYIHIFISSANVINFNDYLEFYDVIT